jgi:hypothetical protein
MIDALTQANFETSKLPKGSVCGQIALLGVATICLELVLDESIPPTQAFSHQVMLPPNLLEGHEAIDLQEWQIRLWVYRSVL